MAATQQLHLLAALVGATLRASDFRDSKVSKSPVPAAETSTEEPIPCQWGPAYCHCRCLKSRTSMNQVEDASMGGSINISTVAGDPEWMELDL